uniref:Uncharacterized protein n=1 Tax=Arundo donax TaxID=35708 RepID=A0A0A9BAH8_ARUDO
MKCYYFGQKLNMVLLFLHCDSTIQ